MKTNQRFLFLLVLFVLTLIYRFYIDFWYSPNCQDVSMLDTELRVDYHPDDTQDSLDLAPEALVSMEEYLRFYKRDSKVHYLCPHITRPHTGEISWKKGTYQHVRMKIKEYPENDVYTLNFYYDDRFLQNTGQRHIRSIVTIHEPGEFKYRRKSGPAMEWMFAFNRVTWCVLLWYQGFQNPIGVDCQAQDAEGVVRNASNEFYFQKVVTCILPEVGLLPQSASIVRQTCGKPTNNIDVVMPYPKRHPQEIGVCMASFYGVLSAKNIPYFVNWMETLNVLGVSEVSINNASLKLMDDRMSAAFEYYQNTGRLTLTHYPPVHDSWESPREDDAATEAINKIATGDCIYRNIKRYWYTLIIDLDEIPIPQHHTTYQAFISAYTRKYPHTTMAHCLAMRSSFFYMAMTSGNPEYPQYLPVLRQTLRFRTEPMNVDGVGHSKSFHNTRNMVAAGHHLTRQTHQYKGNQLHQHYTTDEDILIHHYRTRCKSEKLCRENWTDTIHDDILPRKFGTQVTRQVEHVLQAIGYNMDY